MSGLFGFLLRQPRDEAWADRRFAAMQAEMTSRAGHRAVTLRAPRVRVGISGPGLLPDSLALHGPAGEPQMLAEGECYHEDVHLAHGESPGGPWAMVRERWLAAGAAAVGRLDGLFNLVIVDATTPRLRLVNDRYGSRRLYIADTDQAFVFASELGPMAVWCGPEDVDETFVRQSVCLGAPLDDRTWLRGVRLMPPATEYDATPERVSTRTYWRWEDLPAPDRGRPEAGAPGHGLPERLARRAIELWHRALAARLGGDRVGLQLSGGLDSRLILADGVALRRDLVAVTYGEAGSDEVRFAARSAAIAGVPWLHWALPEPDWLETRVRFSLAHDGVVDIVNAFQAGMLDRIASLMSWEISGFLGDLVLGATYEISSVEEGMARLPYWHAPIAIPEADAREMVAASAAGRAPRAWLVETKCRRAINAWPHSAVNVLEVRKPFLDHALVEFASALPLPCRAARDVHRTLLAAHRALRRVPWQKTGAPLDASRVRLWATRAERVAYRTIRSLASPAGIELAPRVRGAVNLETWLADPTVTATLTETLTRANARVGRYFDRAAIVETLQDTLVRRTIAHEPLLHLYRAERMLEHLATRVSRLAGR